MSNNFKATDSALGYYYQGLYALSYFMNSTQDEEAALIEDLDDVVIKNIDTKSISLKQVKHKQSSNISIRSKDLWTTLRIWCEYSKSTDIKNCTFYLISCSSIQDDSELQTLCIVDSDRTVLIEKLVTEANRVIESREKAPPNNKPYKERYKGCESFLSLTSTKREALVNRIILRPDEFSIDDIEQNLEDSSMLHSCPPDIRSLLAKKLTEWWDYQVLLFLRNKRSAIRKIELQSKISQLIQEIFSDELNESFSDKEPLNWEEEITENIKKQLGLINSGMARQKKAAINYWRAREQRNEWLEEDLPLVVEKVKKFDRQVFEEWEFKFDSISDDNESASDDEHIKLGKNLFDWSIEEAPSLIGPISKNWSSNFLVRGTFQIMSDDLTVGWHLKYKDKIK